MINQVKNLTEKLLTEKLFLSEIFMKLKHSKTQKFQRIKFILNYIYNIYVRIHAYVYIHIYNI